MSIPRAFTLGLLAAFAVVFVLFTGGRLPDEHVLTLAVLPVAVVTALAMFERGADGWPWRLARGVVGAVLAGVAGFAVLRYLLAAVDWFDVVEPAVALVLIGLATACGWIAAAAARPSRGLATAIGFDLGFVVLTIPMLLGDHGRDLGFVVGFTLILGAGAVVGALLGTAAR